MTPFHGTGIFAKKPLQFLPSIRSQLIRKNLLCKVYGSMSYPAEIQFYHYFLGTLSTNNFPFVTLYNRFCPLSKTSTLFNGQYQDEWNTNQNQMKNNPCFLYCISRFVQGTVAKHLQDKPPGFLFLVVLY